MCRRHVNPPSDAGADNNRRHELAQNAERQSHRGCGRPSRGAVLLRLGSVRRFGRLALRIERVGQFVETRPQPLFVALAAFIQAAFLFWLFLLSILVLPSPALRHTPCSVACRFRPVPKSTP